MKEMKEVTMPIISRDQTPSLTSTDDLIHSTPNVAFIVDSSTSPVNVIKFQG